MATEDGADQEQPQEYEQGPETEIAANAAAGEGKQEEEQEATIDVDYANIPDNPEAKFEGVCPSVMKGEACWALSRGRHCHYQSHKLPDSDRQGNLYVAHLPFDMTQKDFEALFRPFGPFKDTRLLVNPKDGAPTGVGFVHFVNAADAQKAIEVVNGMTLPGSERSLLCRIAERRTKDAQGRWRGSSARRGRGPPRDREGYGPIRRPPPPRDYPYPRYDRSPPRRREFYDDYERPPPRDFPPRELRDLPPSARDVDGPPRGFGPNSRPPPRDYEAPPRSFGPPREFAGTRDLPPARDLPPIRSLPPRELGVPPRGIPIDEFDRPPPPRDFERSRVPQDLARLPPRDYIPREFERPPFREAPPLRDAPPFRDGLPLRDPPPHRDAPLARPPARDFDRLPPVRDFDRVPPPRDFERAGPPAPRPYGYNPPPPVGYGAAPYR